MIKRWTRRLLLFLLAVSALVFVASLIVLRTEWLREQVRTRAIREIERVSGGKVEIGKFDFDAGQLWFQVDNFILRGKEPASEPPLVAVKSIRAKLTVVSFFRRDVYLDAIEVGDVRTRIVTYPDGTTNIPGPQIRNPNSPTVFERFVSLQARRFEVKDGVFEYDDRKIPIKLRGEQLKVQFGWEGAAKRYRGTASADPLFVEWASNGPFRVTSSVDLTMDKTGLVFEKAESRLGSAVVVATGSLRDYRRPKVDLQIEANAPMAELVRQFRVPLLPVGETKFVGRLLYDSELTLNGKVTGHSLAVKESGIAISGATMSGDVELQKRGLVVKNLLLNALGGRFAGVAEIKEWARFTVKGQVSGMSLDRLVELRLSDARLAWSGEAAGPVSLSGQIAQRRIQDVAIETSLKITATEGRIPVEGQVEATYAQRGGTLSLGNSYLQTPRNRIEFAGSLQERLVVKLRSTDLNELLPALALASSNPPAELPVQLDGGTALFDGQVYPPFASPRIEGHAEITKAVIQKRRVDRAAADVVVDANEAVLRNLVAEQNGARVHGQASVGLANWKPQDESPLRADLVIDRMALERVLTETGQSQPIKGTLGGTVKVTGTVKSPVADGQVTVVNAVVAEEPVDRFRATFHFQPGEIRIENAVAEKKGLSVPLEARYQYPGDEFDTGRLRFRVKADNAVLSQFETIKKRQPDLDGRVDLSFTGTLVLEKGVPRPADLDGTLAFREVRFRKKDVGDLRITAETRRDLVEVKAEGNLAKTPISGGGEWQLSGESPGLGEFQFDRLTLASIRDVMDIVDIKRPLPFDGEMRGNVVVTGPLRKPKSLRARVTLSELELRPRSESSPINPDLAKELSLRSNGSVIVEYDPRGLQILQAQFVGKETNIELGGSILPDSRQAWNLTAKGSLNLAIFQNYVEGLRTAGTAVLNASVRGELNQPLLGGRMDIKDASVYHRDIANGIEKANGSVAFERSRALLQNFTAQTGGGEIRLGGFVSLGEQGEQFTYRLNGQVERVRVRYPEGASTTVNAALSLTGTSDQSLLAGTVTILRSGFRPRTDLANVLLGSAQPAQTPTGSSLLRGMTFDVRVVSAPNLQLETSLTQGLQADVDLRLRGSPTKPVLLGTVSVDQGEINFFGTRYQITRGTISFFNAAKVEPVLDLDLETSVRAVIVNINVTGPIDKLNVTYRSDPPLQTQDIVALLTVGRTPNDVAIAAQTPVGARSSNMGGAADALIGQAVSAGVSSRLQRFFGVSKVKIDPQLIGIETTPQARLTIEQQISRDITLTYVTNLTGALQQLVRLQWDFNRNWSISAIRDENGVVGADIQFRKRFK